MCEFVLQGDITLKTIEFTEEQLDNIQELGKELFGDEQDPRSFAYVRKLNRPSINWFRIFLFLFVPVTLLFAFVIGLHYFGCSIAIAASIAIMAFIVYICLTLKQAIICIIKIYQKYAPDSLRNKCRFEPSCSEYMILAIEKYGLLRGLKKGICRLKRCNINNGGFDLP